MVLTTHPFTFNGQPVATVVRTKHGLVSIRTHGGQSQELLLPSNFWEACIGRMHSGSARGFVRTEPVLYQWDTQGERTHISVRSNGTCMNADIPWQTWRAIVRTFEEK